jgi:toxin ParE1/3/4
VEVRITDFAECELKRIYGYYKSVATPKIAQKIKSTILTSAQSLSKFPNRGVVEPMLEELNEGHRFIVEGNYKIIYKIENGIIYITDIFDARQNPEKIKRNR